MSEALAYDYTQEEPDSGAYAIYVTKLAFINEVGKRKKKIELRNNFIDKFFWRAHWEEEVSSAVLGLDRKMVAAYDAGGIKDAATVWDNARKYRHEASTSHLILERARPDDPDQKPSAAKISGDKEILTKLAEYLLAVDQLDHLDKRRFKPHLRNGLTTKVREKSIEEIIGDIRRWSEAEQVQLWSLTIGSERERLRFWDREIDTTRLSPLSVDVVNYLEKTTSQEMTAADEAEYLASFSDEELVDGKIE